MTTKRSVERVTRFTRRAGVYALLAIAFAVVSPGVQAQASIKVGEDVTIRFGTLLQGWGDWTQDPVSEGYSQNLYLRRARILIGGQVAKNITFFIETDNPNLGRAPKALGSGFILQDALAEVKLSDPLTISAGLMFVPFCRNCIQSAATLLSLDYSSFSFLATPATQSSVGRDIGFQAKGYFNGNRIEYRVGAFQGFRAAALPGSPPARNPLRGVGRLQINLFEPETPGIFYTGTYLGTKRVLAIGGGFDTQAGTGDNYKAWTIDAFLDHPLTDSVSLTAQVDYFAYDGGQTFALPEQTAIFAEAGVYFKPLRLMPFVKFETQNFDAAAVGDIARYQAGLTYYISGHNANLKIAYSRFDPDVGNAANQFTTQLQVFYY
ncbi:MAG TPA: porin [Gemmatimonadaceae bacterium]|nr:porin [Gemmatimonadaceae bacterium]